MPRTRVLVLALALVAIIASPATAQTRYATDPKSDVSVYDYTSDSVSKTHYPLDLTEIRVRHRDRRVIVRYSLKKFIPAFWTAIKVQIDTNSDGCQRS